MNALTILLALCVVGCGLDQYKPALDQAMTRAAEIGGCVRIKCEYPPISCGPSVGSCRQ